MSELDGREPVTLSPRSVDGVRLALRLLGGSGPDLLICHATGFHGRAYTPLADALSGRFRVWTLDFRGHGSSAPSPAGEYGWTAMSQDAAACAAAIGNDRLYGFGHSMGGAALLEAERDRPGTFCGLFLYEPVVFPPGWFARGSANPLADAARRRREIFDSRRAAAERYAAGGPLSVLRADALVAYAEHGFHDLSDGRVRLACRAETEARTFEGSGSITLDGVDTVGTRVSVVAGSEQDAAGSFHSAPARFAPLLAEALPQGRFSVCRGLGHLGPLEAPGAVAAHAAAELLADTTP